MLGNAKGVILGTRRRPTLIASYLVLGTGINTTSLVSPSFTPANGEVIVIKTCGADSSSLVIGSPTGGSQTYTSRVNITASSRTPVRVHTAVISGSPAAFTITQPFSGSPGEWHSMCVERWGNARLATTPATNATNTGSGAPSATLTTTVEKSIITWVNGDWTANAPGSRAYRSGATEEGIHDKSTGEYVAYYAWQLATEPSSQTIGLTLPTAETWSMIGLEILAA